MGEGRRTGNYFSGEFSWNAFSLDEQEWGVKQHWHGSYNGWKLLVSDFKRHDNLTEFNENGLISEWTVDVRVWIIGQTNTEHSGIRTRKFKTDNKTVSNWNTLQFLQSRPYPHGLFPQDQL